MTIDFYYTLGSPPCRSVLLVAEAIGVRLNLKDTDMKNGDHLTPEYLKMNPQHTVPTIDDNGFYLWESRAIMGYLVDQYAKNDSLYPKEAKARAIVDQRLYFDMGTLYPVFMDYLRSTVLSGAQADPTKTETADKAFELLEKFLDGQDYVAGKNLTIADLSLLVNVTTLEVLEFDLSRYKNVSRWLAKLKSEVPKHDEINGLGLKIFEDFLAAHRKK